MEAEQKEGGFLGKQKSLVLLLQLFLQPGLLWFVVAFVYNETKAPCFMCCSFVRSGSSGMEDDG